MYCLQSVHQLRTSRLFIVKSFYAHNYYSFTFLNPLNTTIQRMPCCPLKDRKEYDKITVRYLLSYRSESFSNSILHDSKQKYTNPLTRNQTFSSATLVIAPQFSLQSMFQLKYQLLARLTCLKEASE